MRRRHTALAGGPRTWSRANSRRQRCTANGEEETARREALLRGLSRTQLRAVLRREGLPDRGQKDDLVARALSALVWA